MCLDLQSGWRARQKILPWFLLIWLLLLPIYYVVLWKISTAAQEPAQDGIGSCLGMPGSREEARQALGRFHVWLLVIVGLLVLVGVVVHSLQR